MSFAQWWLMVFVSGVGGNAAGKAIDTSLSPNPVAGGLSSRQLTAR